jgi:hypothetical protein
LGALLEISDLGTQGVDVFDVHDDLGVWGQQQGRDLARSGDFLTPGEPKGPSGQK